MRFILIACVSVFLSSCNSSDCTNGIQDGNETGVDCGGNCPNCPPPAPAQPSISGEWSFGSTIIIGVEADGTETYVSNGTWTFNTFIHQFQSGILSVWMESLPATITQIGVYNSTTITTSTPEEYDILSVSANQLVFQRFTGTNPSAGVTYYERNTLTR